MNKFLDNKQHRCRKNNIIHIQAKTNQRFDHITKINDQSDELASQ